MSILTNLHREGTPKIQTYTSKKHLKLNIGNIGIVRIFNRFRIHTTRVMSQPTFPNQSDTAQLQPYSNTGHCSHSTGAGIAQWYSAGIGAG